MAWGAWVWTPHLRHFGGGEMGGLLVIIDELKINCWRRCMDKPDDAILRWPFFWALGLWLLPSLVFSIHGGFEAVFFSFWFLPFIPIAIVLSTLWATGNAAIAAWSAGRRRAWKRCLSALVLPLFLALGLLPLRAFLSVWDTTSDWIRFELEKPGYWAKINALNPEDGPRLAVFLWGGWGGLGVRGIVYDESDEVLLDDSQRSPEWKKRTEKTDLSCGAVAFRMEGHFHKTYFGC